MAVFRSGFVALIGRPNAGKSTLTNALVGKKVAITSNTPQTTRHRLRAILTTSEAQLIFVDTPGLHKPKDALGEEVNRSTYKALEDTDVIALLVDATRTVGTGDRWTYDLLHQGARASKARKTEPLLILTKTDLVTPEQLQAQRERLARFVPENLATNTATPPTILTLSALTGDGIPAFLEAVTVRLPEGPRWFPEGITTDQPLATLIAEFIREKVLHATFDEVPHAIGVQVDELAQDINSQDPARHLTRIFATIFVERDSQKGIVIGKHGAGIKKIGTQARIDLEQLLATRIFLDLRVKVKKNWRRDASQIRRFGYGEGS